MFKKIICLIFLLSATLEAADMSVGQDANFSARFSISNETEIGIIYTNLRQRWSVKIPAGSCRKIDFDGESEIIVPANGDKQERVYSFSCFITEENSMKALRVTCAGQLCTERLQQGIETALYYIEPETIGHGTTEIVVALAQGDSRQGAALVAGQLRNIEGDSTRSCGQLLRRVLQLLSKK